MKQPLSHGQSMQTTGAAVLVCGASFSGLATAYWLNRLGYRVTLIEIASGLRRGGTPVDIEGDTIGILDRMGLLDAISSKALPSRVLEFKDADDGTIGIFGGVPDPVDALHKRYEIHRDDLLNILFTSVEKSIEILFGQSVTRLEQASDAVAVTLSDGSQRNYALVFGCDGNRSSTRRLVFGAADDFSYFMGGYFFIKVVPTTTFLPANVSQIFSQPGRTALLNGYEDRTDVALAFRSEREIDCDYRDRARQRGLIHDHFDGLGWKVPAMLEHVDVDDGFYFDKLNQIRMPMWSKGRVVLVGDAGYCVSPVAGMGGSIALIGAAKLADALQRHGDDHAVAFQKYHDELRPFIDHVQEQAISEGMTTMFPSDDAELSERNRKLAEGALNL